MKALKVTKVLSERGQALISSLDKWERVYKGETSHISEPCELCEIRGGSCSDCYLYEEGKDCNSNDHLYEYIQREYLSWAMLPSGAPLDGYFWYAANMAQWLRELCGREGLINV